MNENEKSSSEVSESEERDEIRSLDNLSVKRDSKKRTMIDELLDDEATENRSAMDVLENGSSIGGTSVYFENGVEKSSDDSFLHRWKPEYNLRKEEYWDRMQHKFSCSIGSKDSTVVDSLENNNLIIKELLKMQSLYELDNQGGKAMGYRKAISMLKSFKEPITKVS
jgi:hypothetical protein